MVSKGEKMAADAARLFKIHPATVSRLLAQARLASDQRKAPRSGSRLPMPNSAETFMPNNSESDTTAYTEAFALGSNPNLLNLLKREHI